MTEAITLISPMEQRKFGSIERLIDKVVEKCPCQQIWVKHLNTGRNSAQKADTGNPAERATTATSEDVPAATKMTKGADPDNFLELVQCPSGFMA